jgi:hypothetical protein
MLLLGLDCWLSRSRAEETGLNLGDLAGSWSKSLFVICLRRLLLRLEIVAFVSSSLQSSSPSGASGVSVLVDTGGVPSFLAFPSP